MKKFMTPEVDMIKFATVDVITTSTVEEEEPAIPSVALACI